MRGCTYQTRTGRQRDTLPESATNTTVSSFASSVLMKDSGCRPFSFRLRRAGSDCSDANFSRIPSGFSCLSMLISQLMVALHKLHTPSKKRTGVSVAMRMLSERLSISGNCARLSGSFLVSLKIQSNSKFHKGGEVFVFRVVPL